MAPPAAADGGCWDRDIPFSDVRGSIDGVEDAELFRPRPSCMPGLMGELFSLSECTESTVELWQLLLNPPKKPLFILPSPLLMLLMLPILFIPAAPPAAVPPLPILFKPLPIPLSK